VDADRRQSRRARRHASPITHVNASMKPLLVIHSDDDRWVPVNRRLHG
jgi:dipeptidyl aminopeptidase/acylaminoacyl peptidase